jgi:hypothetical protein
VKKKRVVLIDGDILVFRTSAICESRSVEVLHNKSLKTKSFKNKTEFKEFLKAKDFEYVEQDYTFTDVQTLNEDMSYTFLLKNQLKSLKENLWWDEMRLLISGSNNFRDELPLPRKYKGNRDDTLKPLVRQECKSYLIGKYKAEVIDGCETDDALIYIGYEYLAKGYEVIIVSNDKDSNCYSGLKLYDYTKESPEIVEIPQLGSLWIDPKGKVRGLGFLHYCHQMLIGDLVDGYKPTDLTNPKVSFGERSSYDLLKDCTSEQEALQLVIGKYLQWYPKQFIYKDCFGIEHQPTWKYMIGLYHKCVRMRETEGDELVFYSFAKKYGIDLLNYVEEMQD